MLKFKIHKPNESRAVIKATTHRSGKLGFSSGAKNALKLEDGKYFRIATNEEDHTDKCLYLLIATAKDEDAFKVSKAGQYYYINAKQVLEDLKINFTETNIIYNIKEVNEEGITYYKLTPKPDKKK